MKRVCKKVNLESRELVMRAVLDCLSHSKKRQRGDCRRLFARLLSISISKARRELKERGPLYFKGVHLLVDMLLKRLHERRLDLPPVTQQTRVDKSSGKARNVSILSIDQLLFDHIAVTAMQELSRRIGEYQVSSIKGRGASYGKKAIEKRIHKKSCRYACHIDVKDFYGSINRKTLLKWLSRRVKNSDMLWFLCELICTVPRGIAIGSFLSQTLANIYLSDIYHFSREKCRTKRNLSQVKFCMFQMDDMIFFSGNRRQLRHAILAVIERAKQLGLTIKPGWQIRMVDVRRPVDVMGYRFSSNRTTLRKYIFKRARRAIIREGRAIKKGKPASLFRARRIASYHGYLKGIDCKHFKKRTHAKLVFKRAFKTISNHAKHHGKRTI